MGRCSLLVIFISFGLHQCLCYLNLHLAQDEDGESFPVVDNTLNTGESFPVVDNTLNTILDIKKAVQDAIRMLSMQQTMSSLKQVSQNVSDSNRNSLFSKLNQIKDMQRKFRSPLSPASGSAKSDAIHLSSIPQDAKTSVPTKNHFTTSTHTSNGDRSLTINQHVSNSHSLVVQAMPMPFGYRTQPVLQPLLPENKINYAETSLDGTTEPKSLKNNGAKFMASKILTGQDSTLSNKFISDQKFDSMNMPSNFQNSASSKDNKNSALDSGIRIYSEPKNAGKKSSLNNQQESSSHSSINEHDSRSQRSNNKQGLNSLLSDNQIESRSHFYSNKDEPSSNWSNKQQRPSSHLSNNQQGSSSHSSNNQHGPSSHSSNNQQGPSSHLSNKQQGSSSHSSKNQQESSSHSPNNQQGPNSNYSNKQQGSRSHPSNDYQESSSHSSNNQNVWRSHSSNNQQGSSSPSSNNQHGPSSHSLNSKKESSSHSSNNQQESMSRTSNNQQESSSRYSNNQQESSSRYSNNQHESKSHSSNNQQKSSSHSLNSKQESSSHSSNNQQESRSHSSNNQLKSSSHSSNNQQKSSSHSLNSKQESSSHSSNNQQKSRSHSSNNKHESSSHSSNNQQESSSHLSNNQQESSSHSSNNQHESSSHSLNNQQEINSRLSKTKGKSHSHSSKNQMSTSSDLSKNKQSFSSGSSFSRTTSHSSRKSSSHSSFSRKTSSKSSRKSGSHSSRRTSSHSSYSRKSSYHSSNRRRTSSHSSYRRKFHNRDSKSANTSNEQQAPSSALENDKQNNLTPSETYNTHSFQLRNKTKQFDLSTKSDKGLAAQPIDENEINRQSYETTQMKTNQIANGSSFQHKTGEQFKSLNKLSTGQKLASSQRSGSSVNNLKLNNKRNERKSPYKHHTNTLESRITSTSRENGLEQNSGKSIKISENMLPDIVQQSKFSFQDAHKHKSNIDSSNFSAVSPQHQINTYSRNDHGTNNMKLMGISEGIVSGIKRNTKTVELGNKHTSQTDMDIHNIHTESEYPHLSGQTPSLEKNKVLRGSRFSFSNGRSSDNVNSFSANRNIPSSSVNPTPKDASEGHHELSQISEPNEKSEGPTTLPKGVKMIKSTNLNSSRKTSMNTNNSYQTDIPINHAKSPRKSTQILSQKSVPKTSSAPITFSRFSHTVNSKLLTNTGAVPSLQSVIYSKETANSDTNGNSLKNKTLDMNPVHQINQFNENVYNIREKTSKFMQNNNIQKNIQLSGNGYIQLSKDGQTEHELENTPSLSNVQGENTVTSIQSGDNSTFSQGTIIVEKIQSGNKKDTQSKKGYLQKKLTTNNAEPKSQDTQHRTRVQMSTSAKHTPKEKLFLSRQELESKRHTLSLDFRVHVSPDKTNSNARYNTSPKPVDSSNAVSIGRNSDRSELRQNDNIKSSQQTGHHQMNLKQIQNRVLNTTVINDRRGTAETNKALQSKLPDSLTVNMHVSDYNRQSEMNRFNDYSDPTKPSSIKNNNNGENTFTGTTSSRNQFTNQEIDNNPIISGSMLKIIPKSKDSNSMFQTSSLLTPNNLPGKFPTQSSIKILTRNTVKIQSDKVKGKSSVNTGGSGKVTSAPMVRRVRPDNERVEYAMERPIFGSKQQAKNRVTDRVRELNAERVEFLSDMVRPKHNLLRNKNSDGSRSKTKGMKARENESLIHRKEFAQETRADIAHSSPTKIGKTHGGFINNEVEPAEHTGAQHKTSPKDTINDIHISNPQMTLKSQGQHPGNKDIANNKTRATDPLQTVSGTKQQPPLSTNIIQIAKLGTATIFKSVGKQSPDTNEVEATEPSEIVTRTQHSNITVTTDYSERQFEGNLADVSKNLPYGSLGTEPPEFPSNSFSRGPILMNNHSRGNEYGSSVSHSSQRGTVKIQVAPFNDPSKSKLKIQSQSQHSDNYSTVRNKKERTGLDSLSGQNLPTRILDSYGGAAIGASQISEFHTGPVVKAGAIRKPIRTSQRIPPSIIGNHKNSQLQSANTHKGIRNQITFGNKTQKSDYVAETKTRSGHDTNMDQTLTRTETSPQITISRFKTPRQIIGNNVEMYGNKVNHGSGSSQTFTQGYDRLKITDNLQISHHPKSPVSQTSKLNLHISGAMNDFPPANLALNSNKLQNMKNELGTSGKIPGSIGAKTSSFDSQRHEFAIETRGEVENTSTMVNTKRGKAKSMEMAEPLEIPEGLSTSKMSKLVSLRHLSGGNTERLENVLDGRLEMNYINEQTINKNGKTQNIGAITSPIEMNKNVDAIKSSQQNKSVRIYSIDSPYTNHKLTESISKFSSNNFRTSNADLPVGFHQSVSVPSPEVIGPSNVIKTGINKGLNETVQLNNDGRSNYRNSQVQPSTTNVLKGTRTKLSSSDVLQERVMANDLRTSNADLPIGVHHPVSVPSAVVVGPSNILKVGINKGLSETVQINNDVRSNYRTSQVQPSTTNVLKGTRTKLSSSDVLQERVMANDLRTSNADLPIDVHHPVSVPSAVVVGPSNILKVGINKGLSETVQINNDVRSNYRTSQVQPSTTNVLKGTQTKLSSNDVLQERVMANDLRISNTDLPVDVHQPVSLPSTVVIEPSNVAKTGINKGLTETFQTNNDVKNNYRTLPVQPSKTNVLADTQTNIILQERGNTSKDFRTSGLVHQTQPQRTSALSKGNLAVADTYSAVVSYEPIVNVRNSDSNKLLPNNGEHNVKTPFTSSQHGSSQGSADNTAVISYKGVSDMTKNADKNKYVSNMSNLQLNNPQSSVSIDRGSHNDIQLGSGVDKSKSTEKNQGSLIIGRGGRNVGKRVNTNYNAKNINDATQFQTTSTDINGLNNNRFAQGNFLTNELNSNIERQPDTTRQDFRGIKSASGTFRTIDASIGTVLPGNYHSSTPVHNEYESFKKQHAPVSSYTSSNNQIQNSENPSPTTVLQPAISQKKHFSNRIPNISGEHLDIDLPDAPEPNEAPDGAPQLQRSKQSKLKNRIERLKMVQERSEETTGGTSKTLSAGKIERLENVLDSHSEVSTPIKPLSKNLSKAVEVPVKNVNNIHTSAGQSYTNLNASPSQTSMSTKIIPSTPVSGFETSGYDKKEPLGSIQGSNVIYQSNRTHPVTHVINNQRISNSNTNAERTEQGTQNNLAGFAHIEASSIQNEIGLDKIRYIPVVGNNHKTISADNQVIKPSIKPRIQGKVQIYATNTERIESAMESRPVPSKSKTSNKLRRIKSALETRSEVIEPSDQTVLSITTHQANALNQTNKPKKEINGRENSVRIEQASDIGTMGQSITNFDNNRLLYNAFRQYQLKQRTRQKRSVSSVFIGHLLDKPVNVFGNSLGDLNYHGNSLVQGSVDKSVNNHVYVEARDILNSNFRKTTVKVPSTTPNTRKPLLKHIQIQTMGSAQKDGQYKYWMHKAQQLLKKYKNNNFPYNHLSYFGKRKRHKKRHIDENIYQLIGRPALKGLPIISVKDTFSDDNNNHEKKSQNNNDQRQENFFKGSSFNNQIPLSGKQNDFNKFETHQRNLHGLYPKGSTNIQTKDAYAAIGLSNINQMIFENNQNSFDKEKKSASKADKTKAENKVKDLVIDHIEMKNQKMKDFVSDHMDNAKSQDIPEDISLSKVKIVPGGCIIEGTFYRYEELPTFLKEHYKAKVLNEHTKLSIGDIENVLSDYTDSKGSISQGFSADIPMVNMIKTIDGKPFSIQLPGDSQGYDILVEPHLHEGSLELAIKHARDVGVHKENRKPKITANRQNNLEIETLNELKKKGEPKLRTDIFDKAGSNLASLGTNTKIGNFLSNDNFYPSYQGMDSHQVTKVPTSSQNRHQQDFSSNTFNSDQGSSRNDISMNTLQVKRISGTAGMHDMTGSLILSTENRHSSSASSKRSQSMLTYRDTARSSFGDGLNSLNINTKSINSLNWNKKGIQNLRQHFKQVVPRLSALKDNFAVQLNSAGHFNQGFPVDYKLNKINDIHMVENHDLIPTPDIPLKLSGQHNLHTVMSKLIKSPFRHKPYQIMHVLA